MTGGRLTTISFFLLAFGLIFLLSASSSADIFSPFSIDSFFESLLNNDRFGRLFEVFDFLSAPSIATSPPSLARSVTSEATLSRTSPSPRTTTGVELSSPPLTT